MVVAVELANFDPVRGRITLNLTANRTLTAQRSVTVGMDARRTVYLQTTFDRPGRYRLRLNGDTVGSVLVTAPPTETPTVVPSPEPTLTPGTLTPTPIGDDTQGPSPTSAPSSTATATPSEGASLGPDAPSGTDAIVALGLSLLLLYGVGASVYVLREQSLS